MDLRSITVVSMVAVLAVACRAPERPTDIDGAWVGTITTEGNVTTVVNPALRVFVGFRGEVRSLTCPTPCSQPSQRSVAGAGRDVPGFGAVRVALRDRRPPPLVLEPPDGHDS